MIGTGMAKKQAVKKNMMTPLDRNESVRLWRASLIRLSSTALEMTGKTAVEIETVTSEYGRIQI